MDSLQYTYSRMLLNIQASNTLLDQALSQWKLYLKESNKWMGNFALEDGRPNYSNLNKLSESILLVSN